MDFNGVPKRPQAVSSFSVKVLGGTFEVNKLMLRQEDSSADVISVLRSTSADRWFVLVADQWGEQQDTLALIDDQLEFQIYAMGALRQD